MQRIVLIISLIVFLVAIRCKEPEGKVVSTEKKTQDTLVYLNHSDSAKYVGINTCKLCHQDIYNSFIKTGMGRSFDLATKQKSAADYSHPLIYDKFSDFYYNAFWSRDSLYFLEFRLKGKDTAFKRVEQVNYIVGSGQHTNSHIQNVNGYFNQMPMTFYSQKKRWDLPPGFEEGHNTHFTRKIGLECMSCHNAYPDFVMGSENKFNAVPKGIDCERCHGPGSIHVAQRSTGNKIDTSRYIDYSIVNPAKLSIDRQFDICQRCHLQGNAVLKEDHSFYDFKPGKVLSNYMTVFLPKYENADDEFIMASHADRLKQSQCFIISHENVKDKNSLKPYKDALTCVTCHNPHVSVKETNVNVFNDACNSCHQPNGKSDLLCTEKKVKKLQEAALKTPPVTIKSLGVANCVQCHMPSSGSTDIPHVSVHDHFIRKPVTKEQKEKIKTFLGLYAINEKAPDDLTMAKAYINQYDKFEQDERYLDSAKRYLSDKTKTEILKNINELIQLYFTKQDHSKIISYVNTLGEDHVFDQVLIKKSYDNKHAWSAYRIAESYQSKNDQNRAIKWFRKSIQLAPYNLDYRNKLASAYMNVGNATEAQKEFEYIIKENPKSISAYTNLGFLKLSQNNVKEAEELYNTGMKLNPDYEPLLLNLAGLKAYKRDFKGALQIIDEILKKNPSNLKAKAAREQLKKLV